MFQHVALKTQKRIFPNMARPDYKPKRKRRRNRRKKQIDKLLQQFAQLSFEKK